MNYNYLWWSLAGVAVFVLGVLAGRVDLPTDNSPELEPIMAEQETYVCPMHPQVVSDKAGTCPICGMALVQAKTHDHDEQSMSMNMDKHEHMDMAMGDDETRPEVQVEAAVLNNLGVKVTPVVRSTLQRRIEVPGFVQQIQPGKSARVLAPFDARIVELPAGSGQWLEEGQVLIVFESDELRQAEQAHLSLLADTSNTATTQARALTVSDVDAPSPLEQSRQRLANLGLSKKEIAELEQEQQPSARLKLKAPFAGSIANLRVASGASVSRGDALFEFSGMARATVLANAFQRDAAWLQNGQAVEVKLPHVSGGLYAGVVNQAAISIDPNSQNIGVRLSFSAPPQLLKSAMYVVATVLGDPHQAVLSIPQQALIRTEDEDRVVVALGQGRFKPVAVKIGIETGNSVEIISGLEEGDQVVESAQFLLDSESSLQASFLRMTGG